MMLPTVALVQPLVLPNPMTRPHSTTPPPLHSSLSGVDKAIERGTHSLYRPILAKKVQLWTSDPPSHASYSTYIHLGNLAFHGFCVSVYSLQMVSGVASTRRHQSSSSHIASALPVRSVDPSTEDD
ncbi:hypothetical protein CVT26_007180 [Gymnopilus dilepis]|uniref:Uncharacterized protein n=1 Tax=Gymnopilus dilepis TaxID=231916 RepID=A0A409W6I8_9AGAR|nr:hypothetical protein CVT26_007180 [Gymnopilus dilepis]